MCWALNHQNIIEIALRVHFPFTRSVHMSGWRAGPVASVSLGPRTRHQHSGRKETDQWAQYVDATTSTWATLRGEWAGHDKIGPMSYFIFFLFIFFFFFWFPFFEIWTLIWTQILLWILYSSQVYKLKILVWKGFIYLCIYFLYIS
jgi:hypothetical protein